MTATAPVVDAGTTPRAGVLLQMFPAGLAGLLAWEVFAAVIGPLWVGQRLDPAGLVQAAFGIASPVLAHVVHALIGIVVFPLGYALVARPIAARVAPGAAWWLVGLAYGAVLWVAALYGVAHLLAGFPAFLGFGAMAWASLAGHMAYALALAGVAARLAR
jgi:hypothetical protein